MNPENSSIVEQYRSYREEYNPLRIRKKIKILFIAESPPPKPTKKELPYFYNKDSRFKGLCQHFNNAIYDGKIDGKRKFLQRFRDDGYFLIDLFSTRHELDQVRKKVNYENVTKISQRLFKRIEKLKPEKVVLIGKRSIKLITGCLPFGNKTNKERFKKFIRSSINHS